MIRKVQQLAAILALIIVVAFTGKQNDPQAWIRINQLGYKPGSPKTAVWAGKVQQSMGSFELVNVSNGKTVFKGKTGTAFGAYGPFAQTYRLNFSSYKTPGRYFLRAGDVESPAFNIGEDVYKGSADFCLRYLRQQRSGFNPFLKDSCHTHDGYTMYGPMPDSTHLDVSGGWHDASDYLQYSTTSANATWHLLAAYRDFPGLFNDNHEANGLEGANGKADVLDEGTWGLKWLEKMHPQPNWLFNQIADDRDHAGMRIPKEDSFYGKRYERPVYFCTGEPQGLLKYKNRATGVASTAGKFAAAFGLGAHLYGHSDPAYAAQLWRKAESSIMLGMKKPGVCQTAPGRSPYFYEEDNWADDMELGLAALNNISINRPQSQQEARADYIPLAVSFSKMDSITPWLGKDTARHYQWYPFINLGHYELAKQLKSQSQQRQQLIGYYKEGINRVWQKAKANAFYRGVPFIWCSNNLTTSFAIQCYWYRELTGDHQFTELEQANFDWLFGCNPWGTSMVYGLPSWGDTPSDPHSAFTHLKKYPIDGGLVDGPVYGNIYKNLIGIQLNEPDEYAAFQSDLVVYHDDYGDYSTNEPTMDGTASLVYLLAAKEAESVKKEPTPKQISTNQYFKGAIVRGDSLQKRLAIVFTADRTSDGGESIAHTLQQHKVKASFFLTGRFYEQPGLHKLIRQLKKDGHYLGAHSDQHLLYNDWTNRDSLLVTKEKFTTDLLHNYKRMDSLGILRQHAPYFMPPFEWYNHTISTWTKELGLQLINFTPGTLSAADYTSPDMKNYRSTDSIFQSILQYEASQSNGLNGFILLLHVGTSPRRIDKFYHRLPELLETLSRKGYKMVRVDELLTGH